MITGLKGGGGAADEVSFFEPAVGATEGAGFAWVGKAARFLGAADEVVFVFSAEDGTGATHFVQTVDVEVLSIVERTVLTCVEGLPPPVGVMVLVTGQEVTVVWTLKLISITYFNLRYNLNVQLRGNHSLRRSRNWRS